VGLRTVFVSGAIGEFFRDRIPQRIAAAEPHIRTVRELFAPAQ
jgi:hypothetical protein